MYWTFVSREFLWKIAGKFMNLKVLFDKNQLVINNYYLQGYLGIFNIS